ncbi:MAG: hypothetical protein FWB72_01740 [Firmicutes bacterium]|nr:hypothetical protein [Bacillota bacterium]
MVLTAVLTILSQALSALSTLATMAKTAIAKALTLFFAGLLSVFAGLISLLSLLWLPFGLFFKSKKRVERQIRKLDKKYGDGQDTLTGSKRQMQEMGRPFIAEQCEYGYRLDCSCGRCNFCGKKLEMAKREKELEKWREQNRLKNKELLNLHGRDDIFDAL